MKTEIVKERKIVNPVFRDEVRFIKMAKETKGSYSELEVTLMPGGKNPPHRHHTFTETFAVVSGTLGIQVNGRILFLKPGESYTVSKNETHNFFNSGKSPVVFILKFNPGHTGMENMLRIIYGLAGDSLTNKQGLPKSLQATATLMAMSDTHPTGVIALLRPLLKFMLSRARKNKVEVKLLEKYCTDF